jgi:hypothetical protein
MHDGHLEPSGHNWVEGQGSGPRIDKKDGVDDDQYDAMGNKIETKKNKKLTSAEERKVSLIAIDTHIANKLILFDSLKRRAWPAKRKARM